jgi:hypothetical protein
MIFASQYQQGHAPPIFANWFRFKYQLVGSVFQGRFKAILVEKDYFPSLAISNNLPLLRTQT